MRRKGKPRLPWKRGPVAFAIASRADELVNRLKSNPRGFFSLRGVARLLGVSTQPVRDWVRLKHLRRDGPRGQFAKSELERFLHWLLERAEPFRTEDLAERFTQKTGRHRTRFHTLDTACFLWPKGRQALTPRELAALIGCHPSLIVKAINHYKPRLGRRKSPGRWEVSRYRWQNTFIFSRIAEPRLPPLPRQPLFSTTEVTEVLRRWGLPHTSIERVRQMIRTGELEGVPPPTGKRRWQVTRESLAKIQKSLLTAKRGGDSATTLQ